MDFVLSSIASMLREDIQSEMHLELVWCRADGKTYISTLCLHKNSIEDFDVTFLHQIEYQYFQNTQSEVRRSSFIRGRYCAKQALNYFSPHKLTELCIVNGVFQQPLVLNNSKNLGISIAHTRTTAIAIAFPEQHPMGIDIEEWHPDLRFTLEQHWTLNEQELLNQATHLYQPLLFWSAKEALSKVLKTGLTLPLPILEITEQRSIGLWQVFHFGYFSQYKALVFAWEKYVLALIVPAQSELISCKFLN